MWTALPEFGSASADAADRLRVEPAGIPATAEADTDAAGFLKQAGDAVGDRWFGERHHHPVTE